MHLFQIELFYFFKAKSHEEMEERTETGLVKGHAYGVTALKMVSKFWRLRQGNFTRPMS